MNKGKYRDGGFVKRKKILIEKILELTGRKNNSEYAKSLNSKTGKELVEIYRREKKKRGKISSFK